MEFIKLPQALICWQCNDIEGEKAICCYCGKCDQCGCIEGCEAAFISEPKISSLPRSKRPLWYISDIGDQ